MSFTLLTADDLHLFNEGRHTRLYDKLGSREVAGGVYFAVWAPDAVSVAVFGEFNGWKKDEHFLYPVGESGIWDGLVADLRVGSAYKYHVVSRLTGQGYDKADPFADYSETPPETASRVWSLDYSWKDDAWMAQRGWRSMHDAPISIYELHLGSWKRNPHEDNRSLTYRELAETLPDHVEALGFTHVEFMPVMEHPYGPSWGYQATGFFAPTARFGTPEDLMYLIDALHRRTIGVILDWVPSHFPLDDHGLARFDGTHLYEHADPRQGFHPDWRSAIFNYGRNEVRSFLLSSALSWIERYHIDALRVDAVASMLYLDYSREDGHWVPNDAGGNENEAAVHFVRDLNETLYATVPGVQTFAEESTAWPGVSRPVDAGGLGFGYKWDMGWMHDTLAYLAHDPIYRKHHHDEITFRSIYANDENYTLALSHDEVVHGKGSLLERMPGDEWQQFANLRLLYTYQFTTQGKKLLFMGGEFGQRSEWEHDGSLDWQLMDAPLHRGVFRLVSDLATTYRSTPALHRGDHDPDGFRWVDGGDADHSMLSYLRIDPESGATALIVLNFTPVPRLGHRVGVPTRGVWRETINSDAAVYGGSDVGNGGAVIASETPANDLPFSLELQVPPLGGLVLLGPGS